MFIVQRAVAYVMKKFKHTNEELEQAKRQAEKAKKQP